MALISGWRGTAPGDRSLSPGFPQGLDSRIEEPATRPDGPTAQGEAVEQFKRRSIQPPVPVQPRQRAVRAIKAEHPLQRINFGAARGAIDTASGSG